MRTLVSLLTLLAVLAPVAFVAWRLVASPACRAVFVRNVKGYFSGVLGYLFIVVFVVAASLVAFNQRFFANNLATLDQLSEWFPFLLLFLVPAITMTAWADERRLGTEELLFTLPARDYDILLGKYLAVLAVYTIALAFSVTDLIALEWMGLPDWGPIATTYLGYWLAGAALLAAGMFASALTGSVTVAFVLGAVLCAIPVIVGRMPREFFGLELPREGLAQLGVGEQLRDFTVGIVPLTGVAYFVSMAAFFLYLNYVVIRRRHWGGETRGRLGLQYLIRAVSVAAVLIGLNVLARGGSARADLTDQGLYSLSATTRDLIAEMDRDRPVQIQAFLSPEVPREFVAVRQRLVGLLRQYDELAGNKIDVRFVDVEPFTDTAREARTFGVEPFPVVSERDGRQTREEVYLGLVVSSSYDEVVIPSLGPGSLLEYELTRSLGTVSKAKRLTVGVLETDANVIGERNDWRIVRELRLQYDVESVSPNAAIDPKKYDVLLAVMPSSLNDEQMGHLLAYVESGRPTLIFDDPYPMTLGGNSGGRVTVAPRMPKPRPGGAFSQFNQQPPEPKADEGKLTALERLLKIDWTHDAVLWDEYNPHPEFGNLVPKEYLFVANRRENPRAVSPESPITNGLDEVLAAYAGEVQRRQDSKFDYVPLLVTGPNSGVIPWDELTEQVPFDPLTMSFDVAMLNPDVPYYLDPHVHALAAHVKGKPGDPNVVFVADIDLISDWFFEQRLQNSGLTFDNVTFTLNAVDLLAGDETYLDLRRRRAKPGTLTAVEQQTSGYRKELREREKTADEQMEKRLDEARNRLEARRAEIEKDPALSELARREQLRMAQENETLRLNVEEQRLRDAAKEEKEQLQSATQQRIRETENRFWLLAVLLPPIPAILLGLTVLTSRWTAERREIDPDRTVKR